MDYRSIIESKYNRQNWQSLLHDIFQNKVQFWQQPQEVVVDKKMAKSALYTGKITLSDGHIIAIYEVELSDNIVIERFTSQSPAGLLIAPRWGLKNYEFTNLLNKRLAES